MSSARDESDDATDTHNHNISFAPASSSFLSGGLRSLPGLPSAAVEAAVESAEEILSSDSDGEGDNGSAVSQVPVQDTFSYNTHAAANARPGGLYQPARRPATSAIAPSAKRKPPSNEDPTAPVHTPASKLTDFYTNSMRTLSHLRVQASLASSDANASASNTAPGINAGVDAGTIHCAWLRTLYSSHPFTLVSLPPRAATLSSSAASAAVATAALDGQRPAQPDVLRPDARCYTAAAMRPPIPATGTVPLFSSPSTLGLSGLYHPRSVPSSMAAAAGTAPAAAEPGLGAEGLAQLLGMPPAAWTQINVPAGTHTAGSALQTHTQTLAASLLPVPPLTLGWLRPLWMRPLTAAPAATAALLAVLTLDQRGSAAENAPDGPDSGGAVERFLSAVAAAASATVLEGDFVDNVPASGVDVAAAFCADAGTALAASVAAVAAVASVFPAHLLALTQASLSGGNAAATAAALPLEIHWPLPTLLTSSFLPASAAFAAQKTSDGSWQAVLTARMLRQQPYLPTLSLLTRLRRQSAAAASAAAVAGAEPPPLIPLPFVTSAWSQLVRVPQHAAEAAAADAGASAAGAASIAASAQSAAVSVQGAVNAFTALTGPTAAQILARTVGAAAEAVEAVAADCAMLDSRAGGVSVHARRLRAEAELLRAAGDAVGASDADVATAVAAASAASAAAAGVAAPAIAAPNPSLANTSKAAVDATLACLSHGPAKSAGAAPLLTVTIPPPPAALQAASGRGLVTSASPLEQLQRFIAEVNSRALVRTSRMLSSLTVTVLYYAPLHDPAPGQSSVTGPASAPEPVLVPRSVITLTLPSVSATETAALSATQGLGALRWITPAGAAGRGAATGAPTAAAEPPVLVYTHDLVLKCVDIARALVAAYAEAEAAVALGALPGGVAAAKQVPASATGAVEWSLDTCLPRAAALGRETDASAVLHGVAEVASLASVNSRLGISPSDAAADASAGKPKRPDLPQMRANLRTQLYTLFAFLTRVLPTFATAEVADSVLVHTLYAQEQGQQQSGIVPGADVTAERRYSAGCVGVSVRAVPPPPRVLTAALLGHLAQGGEENSSDDDIEVTGAVSQTANANSDGSSADWCPYDSACPLLVHIPASAPLYFHTAAFAEVLLAFPRLPVPAPAPLSVRRARVEDRNSVHDPFADQSVTTDSTCSAHTRAARAFSEGSRVRPRMTVLPTFDDGHGAAGRPDAWPGVSLWAAPNPPLQVPASAPTAEGSSSASYTRAHFDARPRLLLAGSSAAHSLNLAGTRPTAADAATACARALAATSLPACLAPLYPTPAAVTEALPSDPAVTVVLLQRLGVLASVATPLNRDHAGAAAPTSAEASAPIRAEATRLLHFSAPHAPRLWAGVSVGRKALASMLRARKGSELSITELWWAYARRSRQSGAPVPADGTGRSGALVMAETHRPLSFHLKDAVVNGIFDYLSVGGGGVLRVKPRAT